jgi:Protein of unknown function (DUF664)
MTVERVEPPLAAQEREMLEAWLDFHRATLAVKCEGLTGDRLRERVAAASSLDVTGTQDGREFSLRWIMIHMIEEYARHNGHADLLRQRIDGAVGV